MKSIIKSLLVVLLAGSTSTLLAQVQQTNVPQDTTKKKVATEKPMMSMTAGEIAAKETAKMKKDLNLTADQETQVNAINLKYAQQQIDKMKSYGDMKKMTEAQKSQMKADMKIINENKATELKTVLTAEQNKKYDEFRKKIDNKETQEVKKTEKKELKGKIQ